MSLQTRLRTHVVTAPLLRSDKADFLTGMSEIISGYRDSLSAANKAAYDAGYARVKKGNDLAYRVKLQLNPALNCP